MDNVLPLGGLSRSASRASGLKFLEKRLSSLAIRRQSAETPEEIRGPLGLVLLYAPVEPLVDFIFVHGLRGGSRKTWSYSDDPFHFWPKEWLPRDPDFKHVRIHSFGYNSDWADKRKSRTRIHDFGKSLLGDMQNSPHLRRGHRTSIVLIGHSLGGLVIKKAYLLAKQDQSYEDLAKRFHSIFFLATPHRGANEAQLLNNILRSTLILSSRDYITDLAPQSESLQVISDEFRLFYHGTHLWSFYETLETRTIYKTVLIVERHSAIIGLPEERTQPLNADHRRICKFDQPSDSDFITLRDAFVSTIESIVEASTAAQKHTHKDDLKSIASFLGISDSLEDELSTLREKRALGTCEWLTNKISFQQWMKDTERRQTHFWLSGNPGTGKSILSSHVIDYLKVSGRDCSYYFLKHNDKARASVNTLLSSIAYQMALLSGDIREALISMQAEEKDLRPTQLDERAIWQKFFLLHIFKLDTQAPIFWVIDGLDECANPSLLISMLSKIEYDYPLRVFFTSRTSSDLEKAFASIATSAVSEQISISQAQEDIRKYVETNKDRLPIQEEFDRSQLLEKIVTGSNGCFLWAHLVLQELEQTYSEEQIGDVLNEVPKGMDSVYRRILEKISSNSRSKDLIKDVLKWIVCATRPLRLEELKEALRLDIGANVHRLEKMIQSIFGHLVYIDKQSKVSLIHKTAGEFLLDENLASEFAIVQNEAHTQLAATCLNYLLSDDMEPPRHFRQSGNVVRLAKKSSFAEYATVAFSYHFAWSTTSLDHHVNLLNEFLRTNVLSWIEYVAIGKDVPLILQTARNLKTYLNRRARQISPPDQVIRDIESWTGDLVHMALGFGNNLVEYPFAIHFLIPPLCPTESAIYRGFSKNMANPQSFKVKGLSATTWNDRLSCIVYRDELTSSLACRDSRFAVGLSKGTIIVYSTATSQAMRQLNHGERVKCLEFGVTGNELLASAGRKLIKLWKLSTGHQLWHVVSSFNVLTLWFELDDTALSAATSGNHIASWSVDDGLSNNTCPWDDTASVQHFDDKRTENWRSVPTLAQISPELRILAVVYHGLPILLWDLKEQTLLGTFQRSPISETGQLVPSPSAVGLAFSPNSHLRLLAIAYQDGDLAVIDPITQELKTPIIIADAQVLAASPDGKTLVTGDAGGNLKIFEFSTLVLLYRISLPGYDVRSLAFSGSGLRFYDIRGPQCNIWEPDVLIHRSANDRFREGSSDITPETFKAGTTVMDEDISITAIVACDRGDHLICSIEDGYVWLYAAEDGKPLQQLFYQPHVTIHLLHWNSNYDLLAIADVSSRVRVIRLTKGPHGQWTVGEHFIDHHFDQPIRQILLNELGDRLLVSTDCVDTLWHVQKGHQIAFNAPAHRTIRHFNDHPTQPTELLLFTRDKVDVFEWASFDKISSKALQIKEEINVDAQLRTYRGSNQLNMLVLESVSRERSTTERQLLFWNMQKLEGSSEAVEAKSFHPRIAEDIVCVLGIFQTLLVFLNHTGWICTVDLEHCTDKAYKRHFIVPSSWRSVGREFIAQVTPKGDVVVGKGKKLVVFKNMRSNSNVVELL